MFNKKRLAILAGALVLTTTLMSCALNRQESQSVPATSVAVPSMTPSAPSAPATPTAQTSTASATPTATSPTAGPMSDYAITKACASTPTRPPYVGYCRVKGQPNFTGRQAFNACVAASAHTAWVRSSEKYGKEDPNILKHSKWCANSIGLRDASAVRGYYPSAKAHLSVQYFTVAGRGINDEDIHTIGFDAKTGKYAQVGDTVDDWYTQWNEGD